jgi:hypothetical protein
MCPISQMMVKGHAYQSNKIKGTNKAIERKKKASEFKSHASCYLDSDPV